MNPLALVSNTGSDSLVAVFRGVLDAVDRIQLYRSFESDSKTVHMQFAASKLRLEKWGQFVGIQGDEISSNHHESLDDPKLLAIVMEYLSAINSILETADAALPKDQITSNNEGLAIRPSQRNKSQKSPRFFTQSRRQKFSWATSGKAEVTNKLELFKDLVEQLHKLVPIDATLSEKLPASNLEIDRATGTITRLGTGIFHGKYSKIFSFTNNVAKKIRLSINHS